MKLHNGKKVFYMVKNGEKQGDNNIVNYFSQMRVHSAHPGTGIYQAYGARFV